MLKHTSVVHFLTKGKQSSGGPAGPQTPFERTFLCNNECVLGQNELVYVRMYTGEYEYVNMYETLPSSEQG